MEQQATYDDVTLILRLYELRREERMRQARAWFGKFKPPSSVEEYMIACPPQSEHDAFFRMVVTYWDMAASFVTSGVLNRDLFLQSGNELLFVWEKVRDFVPSWRATASNPNILANLEAVAKEAIKRMNHSDPEAYKKFSERVRATAA
jgi:hypothetical protein